MSGWPVEDEDAVYDDGLVLIAGVLYDSATGEKANPSEISDEVFYDTYRPINAADGGEYWQRKDTLAFPVERVWSVMDGDEGSICAAPGYHLVNVFAYMVTEVPWTDEGLCVVLDEGQPDDEDDEDGSGPDLNPEGDPTRNGAFG